MGEGRVRAKVGAKAPRVDVITARQCHMDDDWPDRVLSALGETVYVTIDIDGFDPAYAPGTGTPEVGGPTSFQGLAYLRACTGVRWVGADVVEVLPALDHAQVTAHLAAQVGYEFLSLVALERQLRK